MSAQADPIDGATGERSISFGSHGPADRLIVHLSDTHLLAGERLLYGSVPTTATLGAAAQRLLDSGLRADGIVVTGDIADLGEPQAYARVRAVVEEVAAALGAPVVWVMGNHDDRAAFRVGLLDQEPSAEPVHSVTDLGGIRVIGLDSTVPGYHHGHLADSELDWLAAELATPAERGTLLALHHPPLPTPVAMMTVLELGNQERFAEVIAGTDVAGVLAGHLHYSTHGLFAGVPVSVAPATSYTMDALAPKAALRGVDGGQSFNLVHLFGDRFVHSSVPVPAHRVASGFDADFTERLAALDPAARLELVSRFPASEPASESPGA